ncbi:hypothetical protein [Nocardia brasiliensis]|uniref:hypothetical protein n=1 Tax=Nocardia brasiliensis TaxID=37326 RepID=UPI003D928C18
MPDPGEVYSGPIGTDSATGSEAAVPCGPLGAALARFPAHLPVVVQVPADLGDNTVDEFVITGEPQRGTIDWGDGRGAVPEDAVLVEALRSYDRARPRPGITTPNHKPAIPGVTVTNPDQGETPAADGVPAPDVRVTGYSVSCLPTEHPEVRHWSIPVTRTRDGRWVVGADGEWYDRDGEFGEAPVPMDLDTALAVAREGAPRLELMGRTVAEELRRYRATGPR